MSLHTPGPWKLLPEEADEKTGEYSEPQVVVEENGHTHTIAIVRVGLVGTAANGPLLAAAPDLYEACKAMYESAAPHQDEHPAMYAAWKKARLAMQKAEGR